MKFAIVLLSAAALFFCDMNVSSSQAGGLLRNRGRATFSQSGTYHHGGSSYASSGRGYSVYSAYPGWYTGTAPISPLNKGSFGGRGWQGSRAGVYLNGGNNALWGSPR